MSGKSQGRNRLPTESGPVQMSVSVCAEIVRRGDPDRFLAAMATSPPLRARLFPIYAFNVEISRAAWLVQEPTIARIRLQWWRDALREIAGAGTIGSHEVAVPLSGVLDAESVHLLDGLIDAQWGGIDRGRFETDAHLTEYLDRTAGNLTVVAARSVGITDSEDAIRAISWASGLANLFLAIPKLSAMGYASLPDHSPTAVRRLAARGLAHISGASAPSQAKPALLATWRAKGLLRMAYDRPERVMSGNLGGSEFMRRASLLRRVLME